MEQVSTVGRESVFSHLMARFEGLHARGWRYHLHQDQQPQNRRGSRGVRGQGGNGVRSQEAR